jgi:hypothetical protein
MRFHPIRTPLCLICVFIAGWIAAVPAPVRTAHAQTEAPCPQSFVTHTLDHITTTADGVIRRFEANGAGLGAGDLDGDGDIDLVLGSHTGPNTLLWNDGNLQFRKETLGDGATRAVTIVDVDGDGRLDIVLTRHTGAINFWRNQDGRFELDVLPGVATPATVLNWGDLDADGDLDLVTGSYDAGLLTELGNSYLLDGGGVVYYENRAGTFQPTSLASESQAMAILLHDLNGDGRLDILVGNDFTVQDQAWLRAVDGWTQVTPFAATTHSTMSLDHGDIDNDGAPEIFASDMKPYASDPATMAAWEPLMAGMEHEQMEGDPQVMENVLQVGDTAGTFANQAAAWGVDGTGWSWSSKFGDLDNDGYLDLYIVNGMMEETMFAHLPNHELVEEDQAFRNEGGDRFVPAPEWQLNSIASGRGMVLADLDLDGDLDIVVNTLRSPAQLFENRLCTGRGSVQVDLRWRSSANTHALGAQVSLHTSAGRHLRDVRAASGYLSGDAARLHFGVPAGVELGEMEILWPDGARSSIPAPALNTLVTIVRP